jgi:hypothetical protein
MDERELAKALGKALEDTLALLDSVGEPFWASKVRGALGSIDSIDPDEILSWYGGMGSFNDLLIATINGHRLKRGQESVTNARLEELRNQVYELATRAKR